MAEKEKKSKIISLEDIERKNRLNQREESRSEIAEDINDVMSKVGFTIGGKKSKKKSFWKRFLIFLGIAILLLTAINFLLANIWLIKFFINDFSKTIASWF